MRDSPARKVLPADNRPRDRRLQAGEEARLLEACREARNPWLLPIVQLALETAMRHEATTRLFEKGLNIMEVATITGHKDLRMLRRYTHLKAEDLAMKLG